MPKCLLLGYEKEKRKSLTKAITKLGGEVSERYSTDVEFVICTKRDLSKQTITNAKKARKSVVSDDWINKSLKENNFIDHVPYLLGETTSNNEKDNINDEASNDSNTPKHSLEDYEVSPPKKTKVQCFSSPNMLDNTSTVTLVNPEKLKQILKELSKDTRTANIDPIFVNRTIESQFLGTCLCAQKTSPKGILPILSQHFGSGKTQLVLNFRKVIARENLLNPSKEVDLLQRAVLVDLNFQRNHLLKTNSLLSSVLAELCDNFEQLALEVKSSAELETEFNHSFTILKYSSNHLFSKTPIQNMDMDEQSRMVCQKLFQDNYSFGSFFQYWSKESLWPIILFFDEYQCLSNESHNEYEPLVNFWQSNLTPLMGASASRVFTVIAGKSATLTKLGRGLLAKDTTMSPNPADLVVLNMLTIENVISIMESTKVLDNYTMQEFLFHFFSMTIDSFEYFCKKVFIYTGGIPRLIKYVMTSMIRYVKINEKLLNLSTSSIIDKYFSNPYLLFTDITKSIEITNLANTTTSNTELERIICLGTFGALIPLDIEHVSTIDLIHDLNIGVELESECIRLVIPKFTLFADRHSQRSLFFKTTLSLLKDTEIAPLIDKGSLLERLVLETLVFRLIANIISTNKKKNTTWKDIHKCFSDSALAYFKIPSLSDITLLPKITSCKKVTPTEIEEISKDDPWAKAVSDENWKDIIQNFFQKSSFQIGVPAPKSKSGDIVLFFHPDFHPTICNLVIKNYGTTKFNVSELQEEVNKCSLLLPHCKFVSVVVFCSNLCPSIENTIRDGSIKLVSGVWSFNQKLKRTGGCTEVSLQQRRSNNVGNKKNTLILFNNMELIILGKEQFNAFFTKEDLAILNSVSQNSKPKYDILLPWINSNLSVSNSD